METLLALPVVAKLAEQFPMVAIVLLMYWQTLKTFKAEQAADREQHERHIASVIGRLDRIEEHLDIRENQERSPQA